MKKLLEQGDIIELKKGMEVYADVKESLVFSNKKDSLEKYHYNIVISDEVGDLIGKYIIYHTCYDGGGTQLNPGGGQDIHENGYHVYCLKDDGITKVDFYQTGGFTAMIKEIEPIGKGKLLFQEE